MTAETITPITDDEMIRHAESIDVTKAPWGGVLPLRGRFMRAAMHGVEIGMHVVPLAYGTKTPLIPRWTELATQDYRTISEWANRAQPSASCLYGSVGYIPGHGDGWARMILDADTADGYRFLCAMLGAPSVITAGRYAGEHKGGAHWYILTPRTIDGLTSKAAAQYGIDVFGGDGDMSHQVVAPGTYIAKTDSYYHLVESIDGDRLAVTPDMKRFRGLGQTVSESHPLWEWLNSVAEDNLKRSAKPDRPADYTPRPTPHLDDWMRDTSWDSLLLEDGWTPSGIDTSCGCPLWKHPWGGSSDKSATAHEEGCPKSGSGAPGGALHCWSKTASAMCGGFESLSKYYYVAHARYGGDLRAAREAEGIPDEDDWHLGGCSWEPGED